jgi:hypothetical protein
MLIAARVAQNEIVERPGASVTERRQMLDRRCFAAIGRALEAHRMIAAPALVPIPLPDLRDLRLAAMFSVHPPRPEPSGILAGTHAGKARTPAFPFD